MLLMLSLVGQWIQAWRLLNADAERVEDVAWVEAE